MASPPGPLRASRLRDVEMFRSPNRWATWPFLPVIRSSPGGGNQLGIVYDAVRASGRYGYSASVILCNLFLLPGNEVDLFALPKCVYDTAEEMAADGWRVD